MNHPYLLKKGRTIFRWIWICSRSETLIVLALKSSKNVDLNLRNVLLLDNQSTFDLCCNKKFTSQVTKATNALSMTSNGGGLKITEKCKIPGYKYSVWYSKKAITNIICLKNLIKCYANLREHKGQGSYMNVCSVP